MLGWLRSKRNKTLSDVVTRQVDDESWEALGKNYVTSDTDLAPAASQAVSSISDTVASLPPRLMHCYPNGTKKLVDAGHPAWEYLRKPCSWLSWCYWVNTLMRDLLTKGNAYAVIDKGQLIPVENVTCLTGKTQLVYDVTVNFPATEPQARRVSSDEILHFRSGDLDGFKVCGRSPLDAVPSLRRLAQAMSSALESSFSQGAYPSLLLKLNDQNLTDEDSQAIQQGIRKAFSGARNFSKPLVLGQNIEARDVKPNSARESQLVESRNQMVADFARAYNMPQTQLNLLEHATLANVDAYNRQYYSQTIRPWVVRFESTFSDALLDGDIRLVLSTEDLTHGNVLDRRKSVVELVQADIISKEEARELLDLA